VGIPLNFFLGLDSLVFLPPELIAYS